MWISFRGIFRSPHLKPLSIVMIISVIMIALPLRFKTTLSRLGTTSALLPFIEIDKYLLKINTTFEINRYLNRKLDSLSVLASSLIEHKYENERLRTMLGFDLNLPYYLVPAEVLAVSPIGTIKSILIDAGRERKIDINMPVISPTGIIGKTVAVDNKTSAVQLLLDPNCKVAARVQQSRASGIVAYHGGPYLSLTNVPVDQQVSVGDTVISSGLGGIFPRGLFIGMVVKSERKEGELFLEILIAPGTDFSILEEVFVIVSALDGQ
ncbi:MAG: rod shape-determining protein MreC [candidate division Zixibacteria bacterium]